LTMQKSCQLNCKKGHRGRSKMDDLTIVLQSAKRLAGKQQGLSF
jgi:hypothetical protein